MNEVRAEVTVQASPERAFEIFTTEIDRWWHRGERYGGLDVTGHVLEPGVGGRLLELTADGERELGRVVTWEPPHRLAFTWRQSNWLTHELTAVEVTFHACDRGTRVLLRHNGFEAVRSQVGCDVGYEAGWAELLSWYASCLATHQPKESPTCT